MPARSNRPRAKRQPSSKPAVKRHMLASGLSTSRSSRLKPAQRKAVNNMKVSQRPARSREERKAQLGNVIGGSVTNVARRDFNKLKNPTPAMVALEERHPTDIRLDKMSFAQRRNRDKGRQARQD